MRGERGLSGERYNERGPNARNNYRYREKTDLGSVRQL